MTPPKVMGTKNGGFMLNGVNVEGVEKLLEEIEKDGEASKVVFQAKSRWVGATETEVSISKILSRGENIAREDRAFKVNVDEPAMLGGKDNYPNPAEYLAVALCGCITAGIVSNAELFKTQVDELEVTVEMEADLKGPLGLDKSVPNSLSHFHYHVNLKGPDAEALKKSKEVIDKKSGVLNTLISQINFTTDVTINGQKKVA